MKKFFTMLLCIIILTTCAVYSDESEQEIKCVGGGEHVFSDWTVKKSPTCQETGLLIRKCLKLGCGYHERQAIAKIEHDFLPETCYNPKKCKYCGITKGTKLEHDYDKGTCIEYKKCKLCNAQTNELGSHYFLDPNCTCPEICVHCKTTKGTALGHNLKPATCTSPQKCKRCGEIISSSLGHAYTNATCYKLSTCERCGKTRGKLLQHCYIRNKCKFCGKIKNAETSNIDCSADK